MFRGGQNNPYDEIVSKTTDENLTGENWELILNLCDKVQDEGEQGARNVVAAILKRLAHRNPNVQLYTLTLAEALTKNCGIEVHREIASRAFTQGLERIVTDRNTHDKVRYRTLSLVAMWTHDFEKDTTLGVMEECYDSLKSKGYKFEAPEEAPPPEVDDEVRRREEEELQRVLEMSMHDKGGRGQWQSYSLTSSNGAGPSGSGSNPNQAPTTTSSSASTTAKPPQTQSQQPPIYGGYVPSSSPAVSAEALSASSTAPTTVSSYTPSSPSPSTKSHESGLVVTRVRALHTFEPTEAGELGFDKGDIIKVVDRGYKDWWRGQLKGRTGIFPVNYVEPLPEPTAAELAREAEKEAAVFNQAANVDRLLTMLRQMDPTKDNLADNEEIQELYRSCMTLRPKIVKLIDKYSQKRADLVSMNESFVKARTIFDRMMEESLARHSGLYEGRPGYAPPQPYQPGPDSRTHAEYAAPQAFGWNPAVYDQPGYNAYPTPQPIYPPGSEPPLPGAAQPYPDVYQQHPQPAYQPQPYGPAPVPYGAPPEPQGYPTPIPLQQQHQQQSQPQQTHQPQAISPQPDTTPQPHSQPIAIQTQVQPQVQPQSQQQIQPQPQTQPQPQAQPQPQPQQQQQPAPQQESGPPFVFDPNATYPDPNVQAWVQYYAQGGTDPTGSVYFISVPGVKEEKIPPTRRNTQETVHAQSQAGGSQPVQQAPGYQSYGAAPQQQSPVSQPIQDAPVASSNTSLNVQHAAPQGDGAHTAQPGSPTNQQSFYQAGTAGPANLNSSAGSMHGSTQQQPQPAYGASPYGAPVGFSPPGGVPMGAQGPVSLGPGGPDQNAQTAWQSQYYNVQNQFANMSVGGDGSQGAHPGPQGVGTTA